MISSRTYRNDGCPFCTTFPRSSLEVRLAAELAKFFKIDLRDHKVRIGDRILDVDIIIRPQRLVIEYDGWYWHGKNARKDQAKVSLLKQAGWKVVRIRESPLKRTSKDDVIIPKRTVDPSIKRATDKVLVHLSKNFGLRPKGLHSYLQRKEPMNSRVADEFLARLARDRVLSPEVILAWADTYHERVGRHPTMYSGEIPESVGDTWAIVNDALRMGYRGLPGGSSLAKLLAGSSRKRNPKSLPHLSTEMILLWATDHKMETGSWPSNQSGAVRLEPTETWTGISHALRRGGRGLKGHSTLALLLDQNLRLPTGRK